MMSGVIRITVSSRRRCRITSRPAACGIRWVKPSMATVSPSCTASAIASASDTISATPPSLLILPILLTCPILLQVAASHPHRNDNDKPPPCAHLCVLRRRSSLVPRGPAGCRSSRLSWQHQGQRSLWPRPAWPHIRLCSFVEATVSLGDFPRYPLLFGL